MMFKCCCKACGATCWHPGEDDPDTNGMELNDNKPMKWGGGKPDCPHEEFDSEYEDGPELEWNHG